MDDWERENYFVEKAWNDLQSRVELAAWRELNSGEDQVLQLEELLGIFEKRELYERCILVQREITISRLLP